MVAERLDDLLGLVLAQQAVVDEHARQLVADRAVHEQRRDGRVDAAGERADDALVADLLRGCARPARRSRAAPSTWRAPGRRRKRKFLQHVRAARRVHDLGVELHGVEPALGVLHRRDRRARRRGRDAEARRARARPRRCGSSSSVSPCAEVVEQHRARRRARARVLPNSAVPVRADLAAERRGPWPACRSRCRAPAPRARAGRVERRARPARRRRRAAGEDRCRAGSRARSSSSGVSCGSELGEHAALAHAPRDQLRVLRAEVEHEHRPLRLVAGLRRRRGVVGARLGDHRLIPTLCSRCSFLPSVCSAGANMISAFWNSWIVS